MRHVVTDIYGTCHDQFCLVGIASRFQQNFLLLVFWTNQSLAVYQPVLMVLAVVPSILFRSLYGYKFLIWVSYTHQPNKVYIFAGLC
jgi:hypothetical protein